MERKTINPLAISANPDANALTLIHSPSRLALFLLLASVLLALLLLPGCINPNSNLSYSSCCKKSDTFYTCSASPPNAEGWQELSGCGSACAWLSGDGKVYLADQTTEVADLSLCTNNCNFRPSDCKDDDGNHTCYQLDAAGSQMKDKGGNPIAVAPICANATPNACIQNQCKARMCGEPVPAPKGRMDSDSTQRAVDDENVRNSYKELATDQPSGLVNKICTYQKMDKRANRLLNAKDWFVDALRLGVGGTFSDYDRARFYLPPSDFYCSRTTPGAVVDRFTMYLDGTEPPQPRKEFIKNEEIGTCQPFTYYAKCRDSELTAKCEDYDEEELEIICEGDTCINYPTPQSDFRCSIDYQFYMRKDYGDTETARTACVAACRRPGQTIDFHAPLSLCKAKLSSTNQISSYYCDTDPSLDFSVVSLGSPAAALLACNNACSWNRFKGCEENPLLLTAKQTVSPPGEALVQWPFTDINAYAAALAKAYPTPAPNSNTPPNEDPRNYYKPLLPYPTDSAGNPLDCAGADSESAACKDFFYNAALLGPAGAKAPECSSNGDCLSGVCDQNSYRRGSCFLKDGTAVDCGCRYVTDCKREYMCETLPDGGVPREICITNRDRCRVAFGGDDKKDGAVVTVCDYQPATLHVFGSNWGLPGGNNVGSEPYGDGGYLFVSSLNFFPCAPYDARWVPAIEFANRQMYASNTPVCDMGGGTLAEPVCGTGEWSRHCNEFKENIEKRTWIGFDCERYDYSHENHFVFGRAGDYMAGAICTAGELVNSSDVSAWRDNNNWDEDIMRWGNAWGKDLYAVPDRPVVAGPYTYSVNINGVQKTVLGALFTSKSVHFCFDQGSNSDLPEQDDPAGAGRSLSGYYGECEVGQPESCTCDETQQHPWDDTKFKLIQACNMKYGIDIVLYRPDENNPNAPIPPDWRGGFAEKTWLILGFGDCQVENGQPVVASYGICRPCSTSLTIASQGVANTRAYCPNGCYRVWSAGDSDVIVDLCDCSRSDYSLPLSKFPQAAGPNTNPDYGFLVGKINEYQRASILPLLDLHLYDFTSPTVPDFYLESGRNCEEYGAINDGTENVEQGNGEYYSVNKCKSSAYPNFLLGYLAANHSAAILNVASLPEADLGPDKTYLRVGQAKTGCPDCLIALEYETPIQIHALSGQNAYPFSYPPDLNERINSYSGGVEFNPLRMDPPMWPDEEGQREVGKVSLLILNIDLTEASFGSADALDWQISHLINLSRRTLQHVGWPTIYRLTYPGGRPGALTDEKVYKALYARQAELTLAGVGGIVLAPLDNAIYTDDPDDLGKLYEGEGQLLSARGSPARVSVIEPDTPFCAAQEGSTAYLHPRIMVGLQKLYTKSPCGCVSCSALEIAAGLCASGNNLCWDGNAGYSIKGYTGDIQQGIQSGDIHSCEAGKQMCEPFCVNDDKCDVVNEGALADKTTDCTALRSTNELPVMCCDATHTTDCQQWPDCDIQKGIPLKELADDTLHPDAAYLIAGLPHDSNAFCLKSETAKYTYRAAASVDMVSEPVLFPAFGSDVSDCGRIRVPGIDAAQVACGTPLPPVLDTLWSCTKPT